MVEMLMYTIMLAVIHYLTMACLCSNFITYCCFCCCNGGGGVVVVGYVDDDGAHDDVEIVKFVMLLTLH